MFGPIFSGAKPVRPVVAGGCGQSWDRTYVSKDGDSPAPIVIHTTILTQRRMEDGGTG
jgi:hypothetical protein